METGFPDGTSGQAFLHDYFPRRLRDGFSEHLGSHPLRREIVATAAVNHVVNAAGVTFLSRTMAAARASIGDVVTAYVDVDRDARGPEVRQGIMQAGLDSRSEHDALLGVEDALEAATLAVLRGESVEPIRVLDPARSTPR
jgi:glutamate dehydrogenase